MDKHDPCAFGGWLRRTPAAPWRLVCTAHEEAMCWAMLMIEAERTRLTSLGSLVVLEKGLRPAYALPPKGGRS